MSHPWRGWCLLRPGLMLYGGTVGRNEPHAHHAVQLIVAAEPFTMAGAHGERLTTRAAVVPPGARHAVVAGARQALLVHLDPRSSPGRALLARLGTPAEPFAWPPPAARPAGPAQRPAAAHPGQVPAGPGEARPLVFRPPSAGHARFAEAAAALRAVEDWTGHHTAAGLPPHPAVEAAIEVIPTLLERGPVRLRAVADAVHLSPSRLAHLFSAHVGIPLRPYVRWSRMQRAIGLVAEGRTLTAAAHSAGFTDGPHFTRVFRDTFGTTPSELSAAIDWVP
ncbi:helix-turn-helix transcriptional regulator [Nonomuraea candida]|uniref:helix-turn-helix transcriptional regulator n=1 Tax=Nonomuraea candida TaxID=359159 RepID=UPI0005BC2225|nr:helix-turn-helix transcriptional regulator [Nonomuraea candida]